MSLKLQSLIEKYKITPDSSGPKKAKTPVFRSSYAFVHEQRETPNGDLKYSCAMLFPKEGTDFTGMVQAAANAAAAKFGDDYKKWPKNMKCPFRDGDEERDGKEYEGVIFMNAGNKNKPQIVNRQMEPLLDDSDEGFYSGCWARASINFYGYDTSGNKGVGTGLNNLLKWKDDERLDGATSAEDDFAEFAEDVAVGDEAF